MACTLSTTDFLNAFSQMIATRGRPEEVTSDNGTNFVGAKRELRELVQAMDQVEITAKKTLKAIVGNSGLTDDELQTAIKKVEALMNWRPLMYEGADPRDEPVWTPYHFLVGQLGGQLAPAVIDDIAFNLRNRWRLIQNLVRVFWKRWREAHLSTLNTRKKWSEAKENLKVGDVVLVVHQNAPRGQWHLGRVEELFPAKDGQVCVVQVSTRGQKFIRPITRQCPLNVAGQPDYEP
ncbi:uncharacterized protein LOC111318981 [Stylophora pistillata]|uniref:uncharacterized protein LOC111318981 n=1 Tax=Stylophora pistillata TaxID=50429 RepID=UPI000C048163|nr:uncharacterized protein LOC111318981 [Stylophora pistillata]